MNSLIYNQEVVSTIERNGQVYFKSADLYKHLGVSRNTWNDHLREWSREDEASLYLIKMKSVLEDGKSVTGTMRNSSGQFTGNVREEFYLTESGLYRACCSIGKTEACQKFRNWVFTEVLPSIRSTGSYYIGDKYAQCMKAVNTSARNNKKMVETIDSGIHTAYREILKPGRVSYKKVASILFGLSEDVKKLSEANNKKLYKLCGPRDNDCQL